MRIGREEGGRVLHGGARTEVIREYTRLTSVWVNTSEAPAAGPFILRC